LPGLPQRIFLLQPIRKLLNWVVENWLVNVVIDSFTETAIKTQSGRDIPAAIKVWAAGI